MDHIIFNVQNVKSQLYFDKLNFHCLLLCHVTKLSISHYIQCFLQTWMGTVHRGDHEAVILLDN